MRTSIVAVLSVLVAGCYAPVQSGAPPARSPAPPPAEAPPAEAPPAEVAQDPTPPVERVAPEPAPGALGSEQDAYRHLLSTYHVGFYRPRHKDNKIYAPADGYLAPVARVSDGGFLFGGQADVDGATRPVIGKIDADGKLLWQVPLDRKGYRAYEGGLVNETPDGNYVGFVMCYRNPALYSRQAFAKITPDGTTLWKLELPLDKHDNTAQIHIARVTDDGSVLLQGHHYQGKRGKKDRPAYRWSARITPDGELTDIELGSPLDWAVDEW